MSDIILDILRRYVDGTKIKKASARSGGEYHSPCPKCGGTHLHQDEDTLDTWSLPRTASSAAASRSRSM